MEYTLEKLEVYNLAENFSDKIWNIVITWKFFEKDSIGKQIVRTADPISANIAEGYGGTFIRKGNNFIFIQGDRFRKQKLGYRNVKGEELYVWKNVIF